MDRAPCDHSPIRCTMKARSGFDNTPHVPSFAWVQHTDDLKEDSSNEPTVTSHVHSGGMVKWKVSHSMEEADRYSNNSLYKNLRPIMWSLKLCGLHHVRRFTSEKPSVWMFYSIFIVMITWLNLIRMMTIFNQNDSFGPALFLKLINVSWVLLCAMNASCCLYSCRSKESLPQFFLQWLALNPNGLNLHYRNFISQRAIIYVIGCLVFIALNMSFSGYVFLNTAMFDGMLTPLESIENLQLMLKIIYVSLIHSSLSCSWMLPVGLFAIICTIIEEEFKELKKSFRSQVNECGHFSGDLADIRYRHQAISRMVYYADNFLKIIIASTLCLNIIISCLMLYNIIYYDMVLQDPLLLIVHLFWVFMSLVVLAVIAIGSARINSQV